MINSSSGTFNNKPKMYSYIAQDQQIRQSDIDIQKNISILGHNNPNIIKKQSKLENDDTVEVKQNSQIEIQKQNEPPSPIGNRSNQSRSKQSTKILAVANSGNSNKNTLPTLLSNSYNYNGDGFQQQLNTQNTPNQQGIKQNIGNSYQQNYQNQDRFNGLNQYQQQIDDIYGKKQDIYQQEQFQQLNINNYPNMTSSALDQQIERMQQTQGRFNSSQIYQQQQQLHSSSTSQQRNRFNVTSRYRQSLSPQKLKKSIVNNNPSSKVGGPLGSIIKQVQIKQIGNQYDQQITNAENFYEYQKTKYISELSQQQKENDQKQGKRNLSIHSHQNQQNPSIIKQDALEYQGIFQQSHHHRLQTANYNNNNYGDLYKLSSAIQQQYDPNSQNQLNSPKYGNQKKKLLDQYSQLNSNKNEFNPNSVQHIVLIAKKIEKQQRDIKASPAGVLGEHNYRVQTAQSSNKWGRQINQAYPSNLIKGQTFYDPGNQQNQAKYDNGASNTPSSIFSYQTQQQQQLQQQQQMLNSIGRAYFQQRNHPQSALQGKKPDYLSQIHSFQSNGISTLKHGSNFDNQQMMPPQQQGQSDNLIEQSLLPPQVLKQSQSNGSIDGNKQIQTLYNQNTSSGQKNMFADNYQNQLEFNQQIKFSQNSKSSNNRSPFQRQLLVSELNRQASDQNHNFSSHYQQMNLMEQYGRSNPPAQVQQNQHILNTQSSPIQQNQLQLTLNNQDSYYKYIVNYGNNCLIVKRVMETRENWREIEPHNTAYNFRWCPISQAVKFDRIGVGMKQLVNHLEFHKELTCKYTLVKNLKPYCEQNKINLLNFTPLTFLIDLDDENCDSSIRRFAKFFYKNMPKNSSTLKKPDNVKKSINELAKRLKPLMQYPMQEKKEKPSPFTKPKMHESFSNGENYFWFLKPTGTNRGREQLEKYIQEYYVGMEEKPIQKKKENPPKQDQSQQNIEAQLSPEKVQQVEDSLQNAQQEHNKEDQEFRNKFQFQHKVFQQLFQQQQAAQISSTSPHLKSHEYQSPEKNPLSYIQQDGNQELAKKRKSTYNTIQNKDPVSIIKCHQFVLQKYVERPMLIHNRKFDIRAWVLVTHTMDVYFFKESVIRTSGEKFNLENNQINNHFVHLTNNAVQRYADNYGQFENGNQMSLANFFKYCKETHPNECDTDKMHQDMKNIVYHTMNSVKRKINPEDRKYTFEIYGYDFLVDDKFNIWLLEINTNPCLDESSPHLEQVLPRMLDDAFKLTLDIIFPKTKILQKQPQINKSNSTVLSQSKNIKNCNNLTNNFNINANIKTEQNEALGQQKIKEELVILDGSDNAPFSSPNMTNGKSIIFEGKNDNFELNSPQITSTQNESQISQPLTGQSNTNQSTFTYNTYQSPFLHRLNPKKETNWPVDGHPNDENMWELLLNIYCPKPKSAHTQKKSTF